ncbi:putative peptidase [Escherichia coli]|uniref:Putative peptidase n=1 Tax=Escherichia coli TaxID=562 RepID=A0A377CZU1_ECOLX|nr:putative peptidase [Escherichia coli]
MNILLRYLCVGKGDVKVTMLKTGATALVVRQWAVQVFRLPSGKGGLILLIVVLVAGYYGVDLTGLMTGQPVSQQQSTRSISPNEDEAAKFTSVILATTEDTWGQQFEKMGKTYQQPKLVMYRGMTRTGCGRASPLWDRSIARRMARFISISPSMMT